MKTQQAFWDKAAARYAKAPIRDEASYQKKLATTQTYFRPDWRVLEFGCGTGSTALIHAPHVSHILATDISGNMIEIAQGKAQAAGIENVRFERGTLDSLALEPGSFDAVLGLNILHLLDDVKGTITRVHGLLKPGGIFVSSSVMMAEIPWYWRMLIPVAQLVGLAPNIARFSKNGLVKMLTDAGFSIDHEWQPGKMSVFIVAKKSV
ncbi:MAG: class I SAM-dependent methyltransferase [Gammaproteobacteria bacterium]|nr:class I SAM-dependent methyltransferase [Gammaproteobacteria bacterium]MDP2346184.1 class I SAM-dependent methyltransferase [Gammaproteobacteria bacterium]